MHSLTRRSASLLPRWLLRRIDRHSWRRRLRLEIDDVVAELVLTFLRRFPHDDLTRALRGPRGRILGLRLLHDVLRRVQLQRDREIPCEPGVIDGLMRRAAPIHRVVEARLRLARLAPLMEQLGPADRRLLRLRTMEGRSERDVARRLQWSRGAVRRRWQAISKRLRQVDSHRAPRPQHVTPGTTDPTSNT